MPPVEVELVALLDVAVALVVDAEVEVDVAPPALLDVDAVDAEVEVDVAPPAFVALVEDVAPPAPPPELPHEAAKKPAISAAGIAAPKGKPSAMFPLLRGGAWHS